MTDDMNVTMTQEAYDELVKELENRTNLRKEIANDIEEARSLGDLSENDAYKSAMEQKALNERRITEIEDIINRAEITSSGGNNKVVRLGDTVEIENLEKGKKRILTLVGVEEARSADPTEGKISVGSPIGKALVNSKIGETVGVELPSGSVEYKILGKK